jgi:hypothetical protein
MVSVTLEGTIRASQLYELVYQAVYEQGFTTFQGVPAMARTLQLGDAGQDLRHLQERLQEVSSIEELVDGALQQLASLVIRDLSSHFWFSLVD